MSNPGELLVRSTALSKIAMFAITEAQATSSRCVRRVCYEVARRAHETSMALNERFYAIVGADTASLGPGRFFARGHLAQLVAAEADAALGVHLASSRRGAPS